MYACVHVLLIRSAMNYTLIRIFSVHQNLVIYAVKHPCHTAFSVVGCLHGNHFYTLFPWLQAQCQEVRKRKELELQILTESIRLWEGEDIKTFGSVIYMSQAMVQNQGCEVGLFFDSHFF